ncbi:UNVERIFIED_CONTAM: Vacuolar sorting protein 3, partial [Sesamum latifolium]
MTSSDRIQSKGRFFGAMTSGLSLFSNAMHRSVNGDQCPVMGLDGYPDINRVEVINPEGEKENAEEEEHRARWKQEVGCLCDFVLFFNGDFDAISQIVLFPKVVCKRLYRKAIAQSALQTIDVSFYAYMGEFLRDIGKLCVGDNLKRAIMKLMHDSPEHFGIAEPDLYLAKITIPEQLWTDIGQDLIKQLLSFPHEGYYLAFGEQIKDLLRKKSFKEAITLVDVLANEDAMTKEMLSFIHAQIGFLLLFDLQFKEAVDHFLLSENMQPSELFPFIMRDPNRWTLLAPRKRYWGLHPPPTHLENVIDDGLAAIQRAVFLKKAGVETSVREEFLLNPPSRADLLESAIENMIRYLQACRERDLAVSVREGVDTLLMYLYRALNRVEDMERLASSENNCVVEELEALLNDSGHLRTLALLYAGKGMSAEALSIWRVLAMNYLSSSSHKDQFEETDLQDSSRKFSFGQETAAIEATKILEESSDQELVLQHLGW